MTDYQKDGFIKNHPNMTKGDIDDALDGVFKEVGMNIVINGVMIYGYIKLHPNVSVNDLNDLRQELSNEKMANLCRYSD